MVSIIKYLMIFVALSWLGMEVGKADRIFSDYAIPCQNNDDCKQLEGHECRQLRLVAGGVAKYGKYCGKAHTLFPFALSARSCLSRTHRKSIDNAIHRRVKEREKA